MIERESLRKAVLSAVSDDEVAHTLARLMRAKDNRVRLRAVEAYLRIAGLATGRGDIPKDDDDAVHHVAVAEDG